MEMEQFMTEREVAAWLRVSARTLHRWRADGSGPPYYKVGGSVRYKESHVADWADNTIVYPQQRPHTLDELLEKQGKEDPYYSGVNTDLMRGGYKTKWNEEKENWEMLQDNDE